jgi:hypothetical protein
MKTTLRAGWAVVAASSGTIMIAAGAFWLSFTALADLAVRSGIAAGQAWIWPLLVDGLIVVATVAVVALDGHRSAWYPWALLIAGALVSVTANAAHALVAATASVPGLLAATVASIPPMVLLASTHLTVVLIRSAKHPPDGDRSAASTQATPNGIAGHENPVRRLDPIGRAGAITATPETATGTPTRAGDPAPAAEASDAPLLPEQTAEPDTASEPVARPDGSAERRARATQLREAGWSNKAIARELGVHASTVGRWLPRPTSTDTTTEGNEGAAS